MKRILNLPQFYNFYINLIGGKSFFKKYVEEYISPKEGQSVLEFGCGAGNIINYFPADIKYTGLDISKKCIQYCNKNFPSREFCLQDFSSKFSLNKKYDIIFSEGVMACLSDEQVEILVENIIEHSNVGSKIILSDMNYNPQNTFLQKFLLEHERGAFLRSTKDYLNILSKYDNIFEIKNVIETQKAFKIPNSKVVIVLVKK